MRVLPIVILLGINFLVPICIPPFALYQALLSYLLVPALIGALAPWLLFRWRIGLQVLFVIIIIALGAALRPFFDGIREGWDFTFDHEPEIEELAAAVEFICAFAAFAFSTLVRKGVMKLNLTLRGSY